MNITVITPPPFEPITLQEVYAHLRLDAQGSPPEHADDAMIERHIATARTQVEQMTRRALIQQTIRLSVGGFPCSAGRDAWSGYGPARIVLHRPPLIRVESVRYFDGDNVAQTVAAADYYVTDDAVPELRFVTGFGVPAVYERGDALRIEYVVGHAPEGSPPTTQAEYAAAVPKPLKDAVLLGVQLLYDHMSPADRHAIVQARESLVQPYRVQLAP